MRCKRKDAKVIYSICDVTDSAALQALWDLAKSTFGSVDIWVNNAGVNSPDKPMYELTEKTKKVYNILGDYPETIVEYCVPRMLNNSKNGSRIMWLTNRKACGRFLTAGLKSVIFSHKQASRIIKSNL